MLPTSNINYNCQRLIYRSDIGLIRDNFTLNQYDELTIILFDDKTIDSEVGQLIKELHTHTDICSTIEELTILISDLVHDKIMLIVSDQCSLEILTRFHSNCRIDSIFILGISEEFDKKTFPKLYGVYIDYQSLFSSIETRLRVVLKQLSIFQIMEQINKSNYSIWYQLLHDSLAAIEPEISKKDMLDYFRSYYENDAISLKHIDQFEQTYTPTDTVRWYTNNYFPSYFVNKALRLADVENLYYLRYFIINLSKQLKQLYRENSSVYQQTIDSCLKVYCGLNLSKEDIDRLKTSVNQYVCTNGFLSASLSRDVAEMFATNVLFEIIIDRKQKIEHLVYAHIAQFNSNPDEQEILFDFGATFQITNIQINENQCIVSMIAIDHVEREQEILSQYQINMTSNFRSILCFGMYLIHMGQYEKSISYLQNILYRTRLYEYERYFILRELARSFQKLGEIDLALDLALDAYKINRYCLHNEIKESQLLLGEIYCLKEEYDLALQYYEQVLEKSGIDEPERKLKFHTNMATIYFSKNNLSDGFVHTQQLIEMLEVSDRFDSIDIADAHAVIAQGFYLANDFESAIEYCQNSLFIRTEIFPENHSILPKHYIDLADIYEENHEYNFAIEYYVKSIEHYEKYSSKSDALENKVTLLSNIARCYFGAHEYDRARIHFEDALHIQEIIAPEDEMKIDDLHENLALCYWNMDDYDKTIEHYEIALNLRKKISLNSINIIQLYKQIGLCYEQKKEYELARENYQYALNLQKQMPSSDELLIADIYYLLGSNYENEKNYNSAIECLEKALEIQELNSLDTNLIYSDIYGKLAFCYKETKEYDLSVKHYRCAMNICKKLPSIDYNILFNLYDQLAVVFCLQKKYSAALETYEQMIEIIEHIKQNSHYRSAKLYCNMSELYCIMMHFDAAMDYCAKSMEIIENYCTNEYSLAGKMNEIFGTIYTYYQNEIVTKRYYKKALELYRMANDHEGVRRIEDFLEHYSHPSAISIAKSSYKGSFIRQIAFLFLFCILLLLFFFAESCENVVSHVFEFFY